MNKRRTKSAYTGKHIYPNLTRENTTRIVVDSHTHFSYSYIFNILIYIFFKHVDITSM